MGENRSCKSLFPHKGGCFVVVPNYTGDRLNYGLGMERGIQEGLKLSSVTVGEDCAIMYQDKSAGRRGLVGVIAIMKVTENDLQELNEYTGLLPFNFH